MLNVSRLADYAVNILVCLAQENEQSFASQLIAAKTQLSLPTVKKILKMLINRELVCSFQGVKGGYYLARAANDISVASIIEAIDGPIALTHCCQHDNTCHIKASCHTEKAWHGINSFVKQALNAVNLYQISNKGENIMDHLQLTPNTGVQRYD